MEDERVKHSYYFVKLMGLYVIEWFVGGSYGIRKDESESIENDPKVTESLVLVLEDETE